jgi:hypothetical protein
MPPFKKHNPGCPCCEPAFCSCFEGCIALSDCLDLTFDYTPVTPTFGGLPTTLLSATCGSPETKTVRLTPLDPECRWRFLGPGTLSDHYSYTYQPPKASCYGLAQVSFSTPSQINLTCDGSTPRLTFAIGSVPGIQVKFNLEVVSCSPFILGNATTFSVDTSTGWTPAYFTKDATATCVCSMTPTLASWATVWVSNLSIAKVPC